jgi:translation initiation factor IF-3
LSNSRTRINHQIRAQELRVIGSQGENLGVLPLQEALLKAQEDGLDLIEISPNANPPVAKIMDYGKYQYAENKKIKASRVNAQSSEIKEVQIKIGTGEHDLELKAAKVSEWLKEKNVVRIGLFLPGRAKYLDYKFLTERLKRILVFVSEEYKISQPPAKSPKGISMTIEKA